MPATEAIKRRRDRCIATILAMKEREIDPHLPPEKRQRLRKVVLDEVNALTEFALDLTESLPGEQVFNDVYLDRLIDAVREHHPVAS